MHDTFKNPWLHYGMLSLIYAIGFATISLHVLMALPGKISGLQMTMSEMQMGGDNNNSVIPKQSCARIGTTYVIAIQNNGFMPNKLIVNRCDVVEFINKQKNSLYLPAFGNHPHDTIYAGFPKKILAFNQQESFIAHTAGKFGFHDHLKDYITGELIINK